MTQPHHQDEQPDEQNTEQPGEQDTDETGPEAGLTGLGATGSDVTGLGVTSGMWTELPTLGGAMFTHPDDE